MIRLKVTDEMIQMAMETDDAPTWRDEARAAIEAALAIVERDLNKAVSEDECGYFVHQSIEAAGCVEVSE